MAAKYADEVIVLSRNVQQYFADTYNRQVTYIPNGINRPQHRAAELITEKYGLTEGATSCLWAGSCRKRAFII